MAVPSGSRIEVVEAKLLRNAVSKMGDIIEVISGVMDNAKV